MSIRWSQLGDGESSAHWSQLEDGENLCILTGQNWETVSINILIGQNWETVSTHWSQPGDSEYRYILIV